MGGLPEIVAGRRTLAFRRWKRPAARAGGIVTTQLGLVGIESIEAVDPSTLTEAEAREILSLKGGDKVGF